jgi:hypothetical protein
MMKMNNKAKLGGLVAALGITLATGACSTPTSVNTMIASAFDRASSAVEQVAQTTNAAPQAVTANATLDLDEEDRLLTSLYQRVNPSVVYIAISSSGSSAGSPLVNQGL